MCNYQKQCTLFSFDVNHSHTTNIYIYIYIYIVSKFLGHRKAAYIVFTFTGSVWNVRNDVSLSLSLYIYIYICIYIYIYIYMYIYIYVYIYIYIYTYNTEIQWMRCCQIFQASAALIQMKLLFWVHPLGVLSPLILSSKQRSTIYA